MDLDYYCLSLPEKMIYNTRKFFKNFGKNFCNFWVNLAKNIVAFFAGLLSGIKTYGVNWWRGDPLTKVSYFIMGVGHIFRGQVIRGIIYLIFEIGFVSYLVFFGGDYLRMFFANFFTGGKIGDVQTDSNFWNEELGIYDTIIGDNSFHIILYGVLSIFIIIFFLIFYVISIKESVALEEGAAIQKKPSSFKDDVLCFGDGKFHITLLSLPLLGLFVFTVVPLCANILIAFTNYDSSHEVPKYLFEWVGFDNFKSLFSEGSKLGTTFMRVLGWTLVWAVLATFTSYFFGMLLAMLINKKGIRFKKIHRTIFVSTIAIPQFVSLLIMSKMLDSDGGIITQMLEKWFDFQLMFGLSIEHTRICIVLVNMWIGIPYSMLMCSGILMNIPADLYESARVDGASPVRQFFKITLPYMLFVTGPHLITQFIGNINNFNVIFLLSGGGPGDLLKYSDGAQGTDLLITWLYNLSIGTQKNYKLASVIGILVFVISATFSLIVYNKSSAVTGEDNFQ